MTANSHGWALRVVIPAHNEAGLLPGCLRSVAEAERHLAQAGRGSAPPVDVTVVVDASTDGTAEVAAAHGAAVLAVDTRCVGLARAAGVDAAARGREARPSEDVWIAMTDADTTVPADWLSAQVEMAHSGIELFVGRAHPDPDDLPPRAVEQWWRLHADPDELQIHGANLGFSLAAYRRTGGFRPLPEHEDVTFVQDALSAGLTWTHAGPWVRTSGRPSGRVSGGFSGHLRTLLPDGAAGL
ncbi:glycosyltransferase [Nocardioides sp. GY 10113]|uniref:glycosyltransferase n=1 Tax=Nocardioides sp. GY 10113 TaxID=2569761 RepID=UPI001458CD9B|nr:glycosyltransferase [Nocardioides sp. GY 10113]